MSEISFEQKAADAFKIVSHAEFIGKLKKMMREEMSWAERIIYQTVVLPQQRMQTFLEQMRDIRRDFKVIRDVVGYEVEAGVKLSAQRHEERTLQIWAIRHPDKKWWMQDVHSKEFYLDGQKLENLLARRNSTFLGKSFNQKAEHLAREAFDVSEDYAAQAKKSGNIRPALFAFRHYM